MIVNDLNRGTIYLNGEEAANFAASMFYPSHEEMERQTRGIEEIENNIAISDTEEGFRAEISDLDLSFIDDMKQKEKEMVIPFVWCVNVVNTSFNNFENRVTQIQTHVTSKRNFISCSMSTCLECAG